MKKLIIDGRILNPATNTDEIGSILIEDDVISRVYFASETEYDKEVSLAKKESDEIFLAKGKLVFPGFVDLHVHFRDPGQTHKEDVESGSKAAVAGGYTTVVCMPNTTPVCDNLETVEYVQNKAKDIGLLQVVQTSSITKGMKGEELTPLNELFEGGVLAISEDGKSVMNSELYREAMKIAAAYDRPVLAHCEDINLVAGGVMNMGAKSGEIGVKGISNAVENIIEARDIMLAEETGARLHLCHCSTKESVELIRDGKAKGIEVSGEVCPHHFVLTEDDIPANATGVELGNYKMNPPLRTKADVDALKAGLRDGILECISTDHAPHTLEEKEKGMQGPFGIVGIETVAAFTYTELVTKGYLSELQMAEKMSYNPARILGIDAGDISVGEVANVTIFDPNAEYEIHAADFKGKGVNMPYEGYKVKGRVVATIYEGKTSYKYSE